MHLRIHAWALTSKTIIYTYGSNNLECSLLSFLLLTGISRRDQRIISIWKWLMEEIVLKKTYIWQIPQPSETVFYASVEKVWGASLRRGDKLFLKYFHEIQSTSSNQLYGFIIPVMCSGTSIQGTPSGLNRGVPSIEVTDTKIMWTFF